MTSTATHPTHTALGRAGRREWIALGVLMLPLLLVSMDVSVLYFATPAISADLHPTGTQQLWIFDVYGFVLAGLLMTMGAVGDRIGRRRLLLVGAAMFGGASVAAAYAPSAGALIAALLKGEPPSKATDLAVAAACVKHSIPGDFLKARAEEVESFLATPGKRGVRR